MNELVRVTFYNASVGFFPYAAKEPLFGGLDDTFVQLEQWSQGTVLSLTKLLDPNEDSGELPVYLFGVQRVGSDWLLGCWNEVPTHDNSVASISMDSVVGQPDIHKNDMAPNTIAGYATYFWVVPSKNVVASLKFAGGSSGRSAMESYMQTFLTLESKYVLTEGASADAVVIGHAPVGETEPKPVRPRFKLSTFRKKGRRAYLLENHERIRKVIRKGQVTLENVIERGMFENFVRFVRGDADQSNVVSGTRSARIEIEYTPTLPELNAMIEADDKDQEGARWDDLGFELQGETSSPIWINRSRASDNFEFDVVRQRGVVTLESIAEAITHHRNEILELLIDD